jgi:transposase
VKFADSVDCFVHEFSLERHVPTNHLLRSIDRFVELGELRRELSAFCSTIGRPSIAPELIIPMLPVGYCFGIRSERRSCEEVHLRIAGFAALGFMATSPTIRPSRRTVMVASERAICCGGCLKTILRRCVDQGLVGGESLRSMPA